MKTTILFSLFAIALALTSPANASGGFGGGGNPDAIKAAVDRTVSKKLYFPVREAAEGRAQVSLAVRPGGKLDIVSLETDNPKLRQFIERRLSSVVVREAVNNGRGEVYHYQGHL